MADLRKAEEANKIPKSSSQELDRNQKFYKKVITQVQDEYRSAWYYMRPKIQEHLKRLKLYNNQQRDKDRVGDPLMYTVFQTIFASLYNDRLGVEFSGREEGDLDMADNLNGLAEYDYDDMRKYEHDHDWIWDAMAFGRSISYFNEFDTDTKTPIPEVWDPLTFLRDPDAKSVNGNRLGHGAMQFGYREVYLTRDFMKEHGSYFNLNFLKSDTRNNTNSILYEAEQARAQAQNRQLALSRPETGKSFRITQGFTIINGRKHWIELANERNLIVRADPIEENYWPLIDRPFSPISHDWDGVSVFDILEDKQRFRAALINLLGEAARADVYPMYLFDETKLKRTINKDFGFNKWLPIDGPVGDAARPLQKAQPSTVSQFVLDFLDASAQRALATPEIQQGAISGKERTLGELELVSSKVEGRYSLAARIFMWSERNFWRRWYDIYDRDYESGIDEKSVRIMGAFGPKWRKIKRNDIIVNNRLGPDIKIESRQISESKKARDYIRLKDYMVFAFSYPDTDRLYGLRKMGRLILPKDEVERLIPLSPDERDAMEENDNLSNGIDEEVKIEEDHIAHLRIHAAAADTESTRKHIKAHNYILMQGRMSPELMPPMPSQQIPTEKTGSLPNLGGALMASSQSNAV